jgi:hypothetical protein
LSKNHQQNSYHYQSQNIKDRNNKEEIVLKKMGQFLIGCSGWNYADTSDKGGWTGVFYPDKDTKRLR